MLLDDASIRPITEGPAGIFTELDVITLAARSATTGMTEEQKAVWHDDAQLQASDAMGALWRTSRVARYAPVRVPGVARPDYMRVASKIVYASPDGPRSIKTVNGTFPRIFVKDDPAKGPGRRHGANRDDLTLWAEQNLSGDAAGGSSPKVVIANLRKEVASLRQELAQARADRAEEHTENERLRSEMVTRGELFDMLDSPSPRSGAGRSAPSPARAGRPRRTA